MKSLVFVLVLVSLSELRVRAEKNVDLCDIKEKAHKVLAAFKTESNQEDVQKFLMAFQKALAKQAEGLLEAETLKRWDTLKKLEADEEDSKLMRELGELLNGKDEYGRGYLYNLCGLTPEVEKVVNKMKSENQAMIRDLFDALKVKVNEYMPAVFETVKNGHSELVEKIVSVEPAGFKGLSRMLGSALDVDEKQEKQ